MRLLQLLRFTANNWIGRVHRIHCKFLPHFVAQVVAAIFKFKGREQPVLSVAILEHDVPHVFVDLVVSRLALIVPLYVLSLPLLLCVLLNMHIFYQFFDLINLDPFRIDDLILGFS